jgi:hypothetical protein
MRGAWSPPIASMEMILPFAMSAERTPAWRPESD